MYRSAFLFACGMAALLAGQAGAGTRFHEYTEKFKVSPCPATPVSSGYIGGSGNEYLSGAAFLDAGGVVLGGTALGPVFELAGVTVKVLGEDGTAPANAVKEEKDAKGNVKRTVPDWTFADGAGFLVLLTADYAKIQQAVRFPWGSGCVTDVLSDGKGGVYVAGTCGPRFEKLVQATRLETAIEGKGGVYLGKMKPDLSGFAWCMQFVDEAWSAPKLKLVSGDRISLMATHAYHFDLSGKLLKASKLKTPKNWVRGVDPVTHATATGGDSMTHTGYEPWRKPVLFIYNDKGEHTDIFYRWNERLVGLNNSRLVSDSKIHALTYDNQGNLLISGWSDGGNSVLEYLPYDYQTLIYEKLGTQGLGFSLWGANAGSFCHLIKINPQSGEPMGKTIFSAYLGSENKPSGVKVDAMDTAVDDSVMIGGGSGWGLIETGNKVNLLDYQKGDYIGGAFVAVLSPKMDCIRFSSCMPGGGVVPLKRQNANRYCEWGTATGKAKGKAMAIFFSGAESSDKFKISNACQKGFGGGSIDGQFVILGL